MGTRALPDILYIHTCPWYNYYIFLHCSYDVVLTYWEIYARKKINNQWILTYGVIADPSPLIGARIVYKENILTFTFYVCAPWIMSTMNAILLANNYSTA